MAASPAGGAQREYADNVQFIQADAQLRPVMGRAKVYVIVNAEELAEDAGNRLLKTLEEPPPFVVFSADRGRTRRGLSDDRVALSGDSLAAGARAELAGSLVTLGALTSARNSSPRWRAGGRPGHSRPARRAPVRTAAGVRAAIWLGCWAARGSSAWFLPGACPSVGRPRKSCVRRSARGSTGGATSSCTSSVWANGCACPATPHAGVATNISRAQGRDAAFSLQQALMDLDMNVNARLVLDLLVLKLPRP